MQNIAPGIWTPDWPALSGVRAVFTTRDGGVSGAPWQSFNLGTHVGDEPAHVAANRASLRQALPTEPCWLNQVHGVAVACADDAQPGSTPSADAVFARQAKAVCAIMTADCLPVLFAARDGSVVGAAHAGWRSLAGGVLAATIAAMAVPGEMLQVWLGPAIGPDAFEVGPEVRAAFVAQNPAAQAAFRAGQGGRFFADIFMLARQHLSRLGVLPDAIYGGGVCTVSDARRYFSYRREGQTGRMATLIWRE